MLLLLYEYYNLNYVKSTTNVCVVNIKKYMIFILHLLLRVFILCAAYKLPYYNIINSMRIKGQNVEKNVFLVTYVLVILLNLYFNIILFLVSKISRFHFFYYYDIIM